MENLLYFFFGALVIIIIVRSFFTKKAVVKRKLRKAQSKSIHEFKDGDVAKIVGYVEFIDEPLTSPLSGRECSFYYVHVEQEYSDDDGSSSWKTIVEEEVTSKFFIKDGNHSALIDHTKLKCYIVQDRSFTSGLFKDATVVLESYLSSKGLKSQGFLGFNKSLRYQEGILESGEKIAVFGKGLWKEARALDLPEEYGKVLEIVADEGEAVYMSDDPSTTLINAQRNNLIDKNRMRGTNQRYQK